jgi:hypothetical protein
MSKKIITDELVESKMIKLGFPTSDDDRISDEDFIKSTVLKYYDVIMHDDYTSNADYYVYPETTADGYEVFIATYDDRNICVNEHVHYYDGDLSTELESAIRDGSCEEIYVASDFTDEYWLSDMFSEIYQSICEIQEQEIIDVLIDEGYVEQKL